MNTINDYLNGLLASQDLAPEEEKLLQNHKKEVTDFLREEFGADPVIKYAGSHEKGTMIKDNYDLDIVCYFPSSDSRSLKEIRDDVTNHLSKKYTLEHKKSAERITSLAANTAPNGYHIDVVPGRFIEQSSDVFIHVAYGDKERMQTNLKTHIETIANSGCVPIIRLVKIWAHRNNINIKTFVLELFVVETLSGCHTKNDFKESFLKVIEAIKDKFGSLQLVDPANTNNVVSRVIEPSEKNIIIQSAENTFNKINGQDNLGNWKGIFCDTSNGALFNLLLKQSSSPLRISNQDSSSKGFSPQKPWGTDLC